MLDQAVGVGRLQIKACPAHVYSEELDQRYPVYMSTSVLSVRVPTEMKQRLDALRDRTGRASSFYVMRALEQYLDDLEDLFAADAAYREWEEDGFATVAWAEAKAELEL